MSDQTRLSDQNRIRSAGKVRRLTLKDLGIPLLDSERDMSELLAEKAVEAAQHTRDDGPLCGAAVASEGGIIYSAPRITSPSLGQRNHALHLAVMNALSDGVDKVVAAAVYVEVGDVTVCGSCRQLLAEYGTENLMVVGIVGDEQVFEASIADLLPNEL